MIPFVDFTREYKSLKKEIDEAIHRVLRRGWFVLGPELENFEKRFAEYCDAPYCVGVNSGTDALYLSLLCAGIGQGDEVIVPVNTALPTAMAVSMSGARPVFVDCDESFLIDSKQIVRRINKKTKAIIAVHLYGQACDMDALKKISRRFRLTLIEDCAQATGAMWKGKKVGSFGDFGCFSFYPTKNIGAYGDGGAIITKSKKNYTKLLAERFYGQKDRQVCSIPGMNSRLDEIQAAVLSVKLKYVDTWNRTRQQLALQYRNLIVNPKIVLPTPQGDSQCVYHLFVVRAPKRDAIMKLLKEHGIQTLIHYRTPLHRHPFYAKQEKNSFPVAERYAREIFSLPMYPYLKKQEIKKIATILNNIT
ncbi:MAG: DegT/DnrJ/EryC1/StrS family aminotransferase [Parcubacteria group bacterium]|nr:DegT/DnrJ/EryC1/StrS family aminotransferase [Parcubacteria group bacterium]